MAWTMDTHELAWAAGFFDGEGSTYTDPNLRVSVVQNDPYVLERFMRATGNLGRIGGGKRVYGRAKKPLWTWRSSDWREAQAVIALMWKWLSPQKREQALAAFAIYDAVGRADKHGRNFRRCGQRHDYGVDECASCQTLSKRRYRARMKEGGLV
jgi:hypothetical protein